MKCIKRNGQEVEFDNEKILVAITKANENIDELSKRLSKEQIEKIKINMEAVENHDQPCPCRCGSKFSGGLEELCRSRGGVSQNQLFGQADDKALDTCGKIDACFLPFPQAFANVLIPHNGSGDQLRE